VESIEDEVLPKPKVKQVKVLKRKSVKVVKSKLAKKAKFKD